ncbi:adhesin, partial [Salmonella enterica subsp. enterica serovar Newport str. A-211-RVH]
MKIYSALLLAGTALLFTHPALATVCRNSNGTVTDIFYDLSDVFTSGNNQPGQVVTLPEKSGWVGVNATCPAGTTVNYTYRSYVSELPVQSTEGNFKYLKLNDYLLGAMSITDSVAGVFYPPRNYIRMGVDSNVSQQMPFGVQDSKLVFKLKVIRPFINMVTIPRQTMFTVYV